MGAPPPFAPALFFVRDIRQRFELWSKCIQEVQVAIALVAAATHGAGHGALPLKVVRVEDVICIPAVLPCGQVIQFLKKVKQDRCHEWSHSQWGSDISL